MSVNEERLYLLQDSDTESTNPSPEYWETVGERRVGSEDWGTLLEPQKKRKRYRLSEKDSNPCGIESGWLQGSVSGASK